MKRILVTGLTGFAGSHLLEHLLKKENKVYGTYLSDSGLGNLGEKATLRRIDLTEKEEVYSLIEEVKPNLIYHLAAMSSPAKSFQQPTESIFNNVSAELNILEALRQLDLKDTKTLIVSTAEVYGKVSPKDLPIDEETPLNPGSPYAVSKVAQDFLGLQYFNSYGLSLVRVRPFNHTGPGQTDAFVVPAFAKKIVEIEKGKRDPVLMVGNLEAKRDFTDVRDMVRAYEMILEKGMPGEVYNIGSGKSFKIGDILDSLLKMSDKKIKVEEDQALLRPSDTPELICDYSKMEKITGWKPEIPFEKTLKDTLDYWRNIL